MENKPFTFGECATEVRDKVQPEGANGARYIGLEHIEQGTLHLNGFGSANDVSSTKSKFSKGDILFGKLRPYFRKVVRAPFDGVCSTDIWVVRSTNGIDQGFLYYWMASQEFVDFSMQGSEGTKMPRAKWNHVSRHKVPFFTEDEQKAIAHILGSLDDKIELNRRMNETLEAMAQALFKSWFIDFDPVLDNAILSGNPIPDELDERAEIRRAILAQNQPSPPAPLPEVEGSNDSHVQRVQYRGGFEFSGLLETARELRQKQTPAEEIMWALLRNRKLMGLKFRRQHQFGEYIADFYCHEAKLVIELDGKIHEQKIAKDKKRDAYMQAIGLTVLRFANEDFLSDPEAILNKIANALPDEKSSSPSGRGGGEGLPDHIRQLFPSEFEHTEEMGWIPKGWKVGPISKLCEKVQNGGTPNRSKSEYWDDGIIPWLTSGEVRQTIVVRTENFISEAGLKNSSAKWLPFGATVVALYGATAGQVALVASEMTTNQAVCGLIPKENYTFFNYLALERGVSSLANQARGSAQQNISKGIVEDTKVVIPAGVITEKFETECQPIFSKWIHNLSADLALSRTRNTLLPQLLSGEMRIPEAEKLVEEIGIMRDEL